MCMMLMTKEAEIDAMDDVIPFTLQLSDTTSLKKLPACKKVVREENAIASVVRR